MFVNRDWKRNEHDDFELNIRPKIEQYGEATTVWGKANNYDGDDLPKVIIGWNIKPLLARGEECMKVYRYEKDGYGPYTLRSMSDDLLALQQLLHEQHGSDNKRPGWTDDFPAYRQEYPRSGCPSMELLQYWFEGFHEWLLELGFKVHTYTVPKQYVRQSRSGLQVIFRRDKEFSSSSTNIQRVEEG